MRLNVGLRRGGHAGALRPEGGTQRRRGRRDQWNSGGHAGARRRHTGRGETMRQRTGRRGTGRSKARSGDGVRRPGRFSKTRRHRLARTRKNLPWARRGHGPGRDRGRTRHRGGLAAREWRTRGLHARNGLSEVGLRRFLPKRFTTILGTNFRSFRDDGGLMTVRESSFGGCRRRQFRLGGRRRVGRSFAGESEAVPHLKRDIVVKRAGVGLLVVDSQFGQQIEDHVRLDLEFASQLVNANLTHKWRPGSMR